ncbi:MAG: hypothetical protein ACREOU_06775, partial [Candidatus Eiseniibacteriota bacterium]
MIRPSGMSASRGARAATRWSPVAAFAFSVLAVAGLLALAAAPVAHAAAPSATVTTTDRDPFLRSEAFARAALFEFVAGRPDRAAELA